MNMWVEKALSIFQLILMYNILTKKSWKEQASLCQLMCSFNKDLKIQSRRLSVLQRSLGGQEGHIPLTRWSHKGRCWLNLMSCPLSGGQITLFPQLQCCLALSQGADTGIDHIVGSTLFHLSKAMLFGRIKQCSHILLWPDRSSGMEPETCIKLPLPDLLCLHRFMCQWHHWTQWKEHLLFEWHDCLTNRNTVKKN